MLQLESKLKIIFVFKKKNYKEEEKLTLKILSQRVAVSEFDLFTWNTVSVSITSFGTTFGA